MTQYNGKAANISRPAAVNIASSTNASPIVITTSANHLLTDGDRVLVTNHATNTAANGIWTITYLTATTVSLNGSTGNGVGGATGRIVGQGLLPTFERPDDGEPAAVADFNAGLESNGDRSAYLAERTGAYRLVKYATNGPADNAEPAATLVSWSQTTYAAGAFSAILFSDVHLIAGDVVVFDSLLSVTWPNNTNPCYIKAQRTTNSGAGVTDLAAIPRVQFINNAAAAITLAHPLSFAETIAANAASDGYTVALIGRNATTGAAVTVLNNSWFSLAVWRPN